VSTVPLLDVDNLVVEYRTPTGPLRAVDGVGLTLAPHESLALVGESGCGKSTLARAVTRLTPVRSGSVRLAGEDLLQLRGRALRRARRRFQIVFQDPGSSLNDRMTVGDLVGEALVVHRLGDRAERRARLAQLLELVGLEATSAGRYPRQLSGGQRQRVAIARALASAPEILVADEPTSSLDVSIQGQILLLLAELRQRLGLALLMITHDLAIVRATCDRVAVMYLGRIVETAPVAHIFVSPRHPYTRALIEAAPRMSDRAPRVPLAGEVPSAVDPPSGCVFRTRCPLAIDRCAAEPPPPRLVGGSIVACHRAEEVTAPAIKEAVT
jgi:oligopeptide/dipeptide ABC transporter ATP-binding protein